VRCGAALEPPRCEACGADYQREGGVLDLFVEAGDGEVTRTVRGFYEAHPFPNYREHDDRGSLLRRGRSGDFTRALDEAIPPRASVVELGCGTGQLSMFLALAGRRCLGVDLSLASLQLAEAFRSKAGLDNLRFVRGNLFRPPVLPESADVVISNGVLHHTGDARGGFAQMVRLAKPGGYVIVGLYNRWGRLLLPLLRGRHREEARSARGEAWYLDQHHHPHETRHTADEVLGWLDEEGLEYVSTSPAITLGDPGGGPLEPQRRGGRLEHWAAQLSWLGRAADGGLWVTVARKPAG
jgi:SAM-dependent methyltransferase